MFEFLFSKTAKKPVSLAIDVGTASVSAVLFQKDSENRSHALRVFRYPINWAASYNVNNNEEYITRALETSLENIFIDTHKNFHKLEKIHISFSEPYYNQMVTKIKAERIMPEKKIDGVEAKTFLTRTPITVAHGMNIVDRVLLKTSVNGFPVASLVGMRGKHIEADLDTLVISDRLKNHVENLKYKYFPVSRLFFKSDIGVLRSALSLVKGFEIPLLLIDIGGEVTSLFHMTSENIVQLPLVPFGIRSVERRLSSSLKISHTDAESYLRKISSGHLHAEESMKIEPILKLAVGDWSNLINNSIMGGRLDSSNNIIITGKGADLVLFRDSLKSLLLNNFKTADIKILSANVFADSVFPKTVLTGGGDTILASLVAYA